MEMKEANIVIVGGGIAGLATAVGLHRLGLKSLVLESFPCLRVTGAAFTTWTNAWHALDALGVGDTLRGEHLRLQGLVAMSAFLGVPTAQIAYIDKEAGSISCCVEHEVRCLKRKFFLETLANELPKGTIRFSSKVVCIEDSGYLKILHLADGTTLAAKVLIGCDGVNSVVARWLGFQKPSIDERSAIRGYVAFQESHGFEPKFLQFIAGGLRYGIIPCDNKSIYWFFGFPSSWQGNEVTEDPIKMKQFVLSNLEKIPDKIKNVIQETKLEDLSYAQFRYRVPWEMLLGNISKDNVCVAGDAFHSMTPDLGQGACSALEDGIVLARCLAQALTNRSAQEECSEDEEYKMIKIGLKKYASERRWRGFDLVTTSYILSLMLNSKTKVVVFLRNKVLAPLFGGLLKQKANFHCGQLKITYDN